LSIELATIMTAPPIAQCYTLAGLELGLAFGIAMLESAQ